MNNKLSTIKMTSIAYILAITIAITCSCTGTSPTYIHQHNDPGNPQSIPSVVCAFENEDAAIDISNVSNGYVSVRWKSTTEKKIKALIEGPDGIRIQHNVKKDDAVSVLPLVSGDGEYKIGVYKQIEDARYAGVLYVVLEDVVVAEAAFSHPNQYVNYDPYSLAVKKANELVSGKDPERAIEILYEYVIKNFDYDYVKMRQVEYDYLPNLDEIWEKRRGICFDLASLLAAMLRSQGIPTKLVFGYASAVKEYHAWVSVFELGTWKNLDPTAASEYRNARRRFNPEAVEYSPVVIH